MPIGSAMRAIASGTLPKIEQMSGEYLKKPMSAMSIAIEATSQTRAVSM